MKTADTDLMLQLKSGDESAFRELVNRYNIAVINLCLRFVGNREDAEDLAQETFIRIYNAAPRYKVTASFSTWLYRICVNLCLNHQRRKKILHFLSLNGDKNRDYLDIERMQELANKDQPDTLLEKKELNKVVQNAIDSLPENQKTVVILHRYQGLSYQEIADVLDVSVSSVESRLHRAKQTLKRKLKNVHREYAGSI